ncbi:MAG TPA: hypothetical protein VGN09_06630 [Vicinamibacteria bacterium]
MKHLPNGDVELTQNELPDLRQYRNWLVQALQALDHVLPQLEQKAPMSIYQEGCPGPPPAILAKINTPRPGG